MSGGIGDAFRHCSWSCRMGVSMPIEDAREIGINHEEANARQGQSASVINMDLFNNEQGLQCAVDLGPRANVYECPIAYTDKLVHGQLQTSP